MKNFLIAIAALLAAIPIPAFGQGTSASSVQSDSSNFVSVGSAGAVPEFQARNPRYKLRKGDSFDLDFQFSPEFNQTLVVGPDGFVTLRGAGSARVDRQQKP